MKSDNQEVRVLGENDVAFYRTDIDGWVSVHGDYYGVGERAEYNARYASATHRRCEVDGCANLVEAKWGKSVCDACYPQELRAKYESKPVREWDGESPVVEWRGGFFFFHGLDEVFDHCERLECLPDDLMLVHAKQVEPRMLDLIDVLGDDYEEMPELCEAARVALDALNAALREHQPRPWETGGERIDSLNARYQAWEECKRELGFEVES